MLLDEHLLQGSASAVSELTVSGDAHEDVQDDGRSDGACSAGNCDEADGDNDDFDSAFPQVREFTLEGSLAVPAGTLSCVSLRSAWSSVLLLRQQFCAIQGSAQALQVP